MGHVLNNHEKKTECFNRNAFKSFVCNRTLADGARTPWDKVWENVFLKNHLIQSAV